MNYFGVLRLVQAFAPVLAKNGGGAIGNVGSVVGLSNFPMFASYSVSKAAVRSLTQALRVQLAEQGTQVFGIYPGPVDTDMAAELPLEKATTASVADRDPRPASRRERWRSIPIRSPSSSVSSSRRARWASNATSRHATPQAA